MSNNYCPDVFASGERNSLCRFLCLGLFMVVICSRSLGSDAVGFTHNSPDCATPLSTDTGAVHADVTVSPDAVPGQYSFYALLNGASIYNGGTGVHVNEDHTWSVTDGYAQYQYSQLQFSESYVFTAVLLDAPDGGENTWQQVGSCSARNGGVLCDGANSGAQSDALLSIQIGHPPPDDGQTRLCDLTIACPDCPKSQPMAQYSIHLLLASLHITDTPISYNSSRGPSTDFMVVYNQREANQPSPFPSSNFGPKWTFNWLSYVTDDGTAAPASAAVYVRGGGTEKYTDFNSATQSYAADKQTLAVLVRTPIGYEKRFPDGSKEVFSQSDGSTSYPRRIFLTSVVDPTGENAIALTYDSSFRITAITDSLNPPITLTYPLTGDTSKIIKVTDPFGRFATFDYTNGQLTRITDPIGIRSEFEYEPGTDFINAMITPYGRTTFEKGGSGNSQRWLEVTDPLLAKERVEYNNSAPNIPTKESSAPSGVYNANLQFRNTFYWNKKAMEEAPGDYTKAQIIHWLATPDGKVSGIKASEKKPLESRVWYSYAGQTCANNQIIRTG